MLCRMSRSLLLTHAYSMTYRVQVLLAGDFLQLPPIYKAIHDETYRLLDGDALRHNIARMSMAKE